METLGTEGLKQNEHDDGNYLKPNIVIRTKFIGPWYSNKIFKFELRDKSNSYSEF